MTNSQKHNIKPLSYQEMCNYLHFLDETIFDLVEKRKVYLDVYTALIEQKARKNNFVYWMINNYYQTIILTLCRVLEPKKDDHERKTLKHFIHSLKDDRNYDIIRQAADTAQIELHDHNGDIECEDISGEMQKILNSIDFDQDITDIEAMYDRLKTIRNKKLAHLTDVIIKEEDRLKIIELHQFIDKIIEMAKKYHALFRFGVNYGENEKNNYFNFELVLK